MHKRSSECDFVAMAGRSKAREQALAEGEPCSVPIARDSCRSKELGNGERIGADNNAWSVRDHDV